ncbi:MAG: Stage II sporulation protein E (SpoIIE) [Methanosaeta sp. PtaB.Bin039]|nr:MAG: Stage II sporulation protein E (SpoIIE) [Methanosaeta sp. PtaB.Bin039]
MADLGGLRTKLVVLAVLASLLPLCIASFVTLQELNRSAAEVSDFLYQLNSTTMNHSALSFATSNDTDQEQLALAKAAQYDAFFQSKEWQNRMLAEAVSSGRLERNCSMTAGTYTWKVNTTSATDPLSALCGPAGAMQRIMDMDKTIGRGYLVTEAGQMIYWPADTKISWPSNYDPTKESWYDEARRAGQTIWLDQGLTSTREGLNVVCATPVYRGIYLFGVVASESSVSSIYADLSGLRGRAYPFVVDKEGSIVMFPKIRRGDAPWDDLLISGSLRSSALTGMKELYQDIKGRLPGAKVVSLGGKDWYIAHAPIKTVGWTLVIAFPAEEMLLPASFIESGVRQAARQATSGLDQSADRLKVTLILLTLVFVTSFAGLAYLLSARIESSAASLSGSARRMAHGELGARVDQGSQLPDLARSMEEMREGLRSHLDRSCSEAMETGRQSRDRELSIQLGRDIQPSRLPVVDNYQTAARLVEGGDIGPAARSFYDLMETEDGRLVLSIGQVSGEGALALALAATTRALLRALSPVCAPAEVLRQTNLRLSEGAAGMPVSCFYAMIDPESRDMEYVNCGHLPPFLVGPDGSVDTLSGGGMALGLIDRIDPQPVVLRLQEGDVLVAYTDGLIDGGRGRPDLEKLIEVIREKRHLSAAELIDAADREIVKRGRQPAQGSIILILKATEKS